MTIGTTISAILVPCDGMNTQFDYPFLIPFASSAVVAYFAPGSPTLVVVSPTQYTVSGIGNPSGGVVTYPLSGPPLAAGSLIAIGRLLPMVQAVSLASQGPTFAAIEQGLDYQMMISQQLQTLVNALQAEITGITTSTAVQQVQSLPTIAALRAFSGPPTLPVWVGGYYSTADGGEGWFGYNPLDSTSPDNGGTIIVDGLGRRWDRALQGQPPTLKQFGAKGDGATDDTVAVQAALNLATHVAAGPGAYRVQTLTMPSGCWLEGNGLVEVFFVPVTAGETILTSKVYVGTATSFKVTTLSFLSTAIPPTGVAISMTGSSSTSFLTNVYIENCEFAGFTTSVSARFCVNSQFSGLFANNCTTPFISNSVEGLWQGCVAANVTGAAGNTGYAFTVQNPPPFGGTQFVGCQSIGQAGGIIASNAPRVVVEGFQSFSASSTAISLFGCSNWEVSGGQLTPLSTAIVGFSCDTASSNITFSGSNVTGASVGVLAGGSGVAINGNILQENMLDIGVVGTGSLRINITGNICRSATASASILEFAGSDYTLVTGNQVIGAITLVGAHSSSTSFNATIT